LKFDRLFPLMMLKGGEIDATITKY